MTGPISLVHDKPQTPSEAQFSLPFVAACAVFHGAVHIADLNVETLQSTRVQGLMQKIRITKADDLSADDMRKRYPESARVQVVLNNGTERNGFCGEAYGMPKRPLKDDDFLAKVDECLTFAHGFADIEGILDKGILELSKRLYGKVSNNPNVLSINQEGVAIYK